MDFKELRQILDVTVSEALTGEGFRRTSAGTWSRRRGDELNVIQLQEHSIEKTFCVNLGVHYIFLPKAGVEAPLDDENIEIFDCELKFRLTDYDGVNDQWWMIAASSVERVAQLIYKRGLFVFDLYKLDGPISKMDGKDIEGDNPGLLASITKVRACLLLSRMYEHLGNYNKCIEVAEVGVRLAGMAVGPRKVLKNILRRAEKFTHS